MGAVIVLTGVICMMCLIIFQILLTLGFPLGEFSMGGKHKVFSRKMRIASAISALILILASLLLLHLGDIIYFEPFNDIAKPAGYIFGGYLCLNTLLNLMSDSKKEKYTMTPLSAITAFCFIYTSIVF